MAKLKHCLAMTGHSSSCFKGHSLRIGAATHVAAQGYMDNQIKAMGRWKSDAYKKYIRISSFKV